MTYIDNASIFDMGSVLKRPFDITKFHQELSCKRAFDDFKQYWDNNLESVEKGNINSHLFLNIIKEYTQSAKSLDEIIHIYKDCTNTIYKDTLNIIYNFLTRIIIIRTRFCTIIRFKIKS